MTSRSPTAHVAIARQVGHAGGTPPQATLPPAPLPTQRLKVLNQHQIEKAISALFHLGFTWKRIAAAVDLPLSTTRQRAYRMGLRRYQDGNKPQAVVTHKTVQNRRFHQKHPEKRKAHKMVEAALASGALSRSNCERCGAEEAQAHHHDYGQPLSVRWLCQECHSAEHRP